MRHDTQVSVGLADYEALGALEAHDRSRLLWAVLDYAFKGTLPDFDDPEWLAFGAHAKCLRGLFYGLAPRMVGAHSVRVAVEHAEALARSRAERGDDE